MRWGPGHRSANVEDRRGGGGRFIRGAGGMGVGTLVILLILSLVFKRDFFSLVGAGGVETAPETAAGPPAETTPEEERLVSFVSFVLDDAQNVWQQQLGSSYRPAKLVLFRDAVQSACGFAESATGPFYCPGDEKVYIDLGFYEELQQRFGAPGDFAQAYVLAHEIGHHVQNLLGTEAAVRRARETRADSPMRCRSGLSSRPIATPACGLTAPRSGSCWSTVTWRRDWVRRLRWATTGYSGWAAGGWSPSPSLTVRRSSDSNGSGAAWKPAGRTPATRSEADLPKSSSPAHHPARRRAPPHLAHDEALHDPEL